MAIPHAEPGEVIRVRPFGAALADQITHTLVKTDELEIIRLVLAPGKEIVTHSAPGPLVVQCLEGRATFTTLGKDIELEPGDLLHLRAGEPHSVRASQAASLLLTILLPGT
jgi:quercetin dioxygenase-like cupin family protein